MFRVSVETGLDGIKKHLSTCGYEVVDMAECIRPVQAVVYCAETVKAAHPLRYDGSGPLLINASHLTKEQVAATLQAPFQ